LNLQFPPILNLRIGGDRAVPAVALAALRAARDVTQMSKNYDCRT
jgi:hypothetical protein